MQIVMNNWTGIELEPYMEVAEDVIIESLSFENVQFETEISVLFVTDEQIQELNRDHRHIDAVTDVLSFPLLEAEEVQKLNAAYAGKDEDADGEEPGIPIGDIVIAYGRACEQASEYGHSIKREIGFLTAHSMLHLLGYDHMTPDDEAEMIRRQEAILQSLGITREDGI